MHRFTPERADCLHSATAMDTEIGDRNVTLDFNKYIIHKEYDKYET